MPGASGQVILAVDDSASMRQMVRYTLEGAGYKVVQAADGVEALEFAKTSPADLVLTDVNMPRATYCGCWSMQRGSWHAAAGMPRAASSAAASSGSRCAAQSARSASSASWLAARAS